MGRKKELTPLDLVCMAACSVGMSYGYYVAAGMPGFQEFCKAHKPDRTGEAMPKRAKLCRYCKKELEDPRRSYCNMACRLAHQRKLREGMPVPKEAPETGICACGNTFVRSGHGPRRMWCDKCQKARKLQLRKERREREKGAVNERK